MSFIKIYEKVVEEALSNLENGNKVDFKKNMNLLLNLWSKTLIESNNLSESNLYKTLDNNLYILFEFMLKKEYLEELIEYIEEYIRILVSNKSNSVKFEIPFIVILLFEHTEFIDKSNYIEKMKNLLWELKNIENVNTTDIYKNNLSFYNGIINNKNIESKDLHEIKAAYFKDLLDLIEKDIDIKVKKIEMKTFYWIMRDLLLEEDVFALSDLLEQILKYRNASIYPTFNKIIIHLFFNVYYLAIREPNITNIKKKSLMDIFINKLIIRGKPIQEFLEDIYIEDLWNIFNEMYEEYGSYEWQINDRYEVVHQLRMHQYIIEFFVFYSDYLGKKGYFDLTEDVFDSIDVDRLKQVVGIFDRWGNIETRKLEERKKFSILLKEPNMKKSWESEGNPNKFGKELIEIFKRKLIKKWQEKRKAILVSNNFKKIIRERIDKMPFTKIGDNYKSDANDIVVELEKRKDIKFDIKLNNLNNDFSLEKLVDKVIASIENEIISEMNPINLSGSGWSEREIKRFINILEDDILIHSIIKSKNSEKSLSSLRNIKAYGSFQRVSNSMIFNDELIDLRDIKIKIDFAELSEEEVTKKSYENYGINENSFKIDLDPAIEILLNEEEIHEYVSNNYLNVIIKFEGKVLKKSETIGYII